VIAPGGGRLGILLPGIGAVSTTFMAGVAAVRKGIAKPIGSLTQMGTIRLGKRTDNRVPAIKDFVPLAGLDGLSFGGWDIFPDNAYEAAVKAGVLEARLLQQVQPELEAVKPMPAVFDRRYVKKLDGPNVKTGGTWWEKAQVLREDIERFRRANRCDRLVMIWCGSTEIYMDPAPEHASIQAFERGAPTSRRAWSTRTRRSRPGSRTRTAPRSSAPRFRLSSSWRARTACRSPGKISRPGRP
jgi:myo-inositol-1-phosphate synthase